LKHPLPPQKAHLPLATAATCPELLLLQLLLLQLLLLQLLLLQLQSGPQL
jgi:hypothetical protein